MYFVANLHVLTLATIQVGQQYKTRRASWPSGQLGPTYLPLSPRLMYGTSRLAWLNFVLMSLYSFQATKIASTTAQKTKEISQSVNEKVNIVIGIHVVV